MVRTSWQDDDERRVIEDVQQYGWHIVGVDDDQEGPGFAYSIGLYHTLNQPEIIVFGLSSFKTMAQVIKYYWRGDERGNEVRGLEGERSNP